MRSKQPPQFGFSANVWVPDKENAFCLGKIVDIGSDTINVELTNGAMQSLVGSRNKPIIKSFQYDDIYPAENESTKDVDDNCALMFLNQATVLQNIRKRYTKDCVYTYVANILLAINPYKSIPSLYCFENEQRYHGKSIGSLPPHVFAIGDKAYREMKHMKLNQSIIVSGESGSGKTESVKYILRYLTSSYGHENGVIEERLIDSNPLLEAFGNAKTTRNNNSSRFGKFIELHFAKDFTIAGGYISHYLLERTRICKQSSGERNYHIFYLLCCAADHELRQKLELSSPDQFDILCQGCTQYFLTAATEQKVDATAKSPDQCKLGPLKDIQLDDYNSMQSCIRAMRNMNMSKELQFCVFATVAAIMHLGNVRFETAIDSSDGACVVTESTKHSLDKASRMLQVDKEELCNAIMFRVMKTASTSGRSNSVIFVPLNKDGAIHARDALCKQICGSVILKIHSNESINCLKICQTYISLM